MVYTPLSKNPLGVLSRYSADSIISATPDKLKEYLSETMPLLKSQKIELPPPLDAEVRNALEKLESTLRIAMMGGDSKEKVDALKELDSWQKSYRNSFEGNAEMQTAEPMAIAVYGSGQENFNIAPIVKDTLYLADTGFFKARRLQDNLPEAVQSRLNLFAQIMQMYAKSPTQEGLTGIRKATIEGGIYASLFGVNFLDAYRPDIVAAVTRFIKTCLTKPYGNDSSAHAIAESGLGIEYKERLFTTTVDLAARLIEGFGGSLHYDFGEELTRAVAAYADRTNRDIGSLVQQLQSEQDPDARQMLVKEMEVRRESAVRVGSRYNIPMPPPRIKVQHFQLPRPPKRKTKP